MDFGTKIRNTREDMDLSQADMARLIPMNQSNYSKIERGVQEPNMDQLRQICRILHIDPRYLLELDEFEMLTAADWKLLNDAKAFIKRNTPDD